MNKVFTGLVVVVLLALGYVTVKSVYDPVVFDREQEAREAILQKQLKKIATYQDAFGERYGRYATAEELVAFLESGKLFYVKAEGEVTEAMREQGLTEAQAVAKGLIRRDTVWVSAKDSLIKDGTDITTLFNILNTGNKITIDTAYLQQEIGKDTVNVSVMQAVIPFEAYLSDLDKERLEQKKREVAAKAKAYAGLKIGSLEEVKLTGNWE